MQGDGVTDGDAGEERIKRAGVLLLDLAREFLCGRVDAPWRGCLSRGRIKRVEERQWLAEKLGQFSDDPRFNLARRNAPARILVRIAAMLKAAADIIAVAALCAMLAGREAWVATSGSPAA